MIKIYLRTAASIVFVLVAAKVSAQSAVWLPQNVTTGNISYVGNNTTDNVGIGVSSPLAKLHIVSTTSDEMLRLGNGTRDILIKMNTSAGLATLFSSANVNGVNLFSFGGTILSTHGNSVGIGTLAFNVDGNGLMFTEMGKASFGNYYSAVFPSESIGMMVTYTDPQQTQLVVRGPASPVADLQRWENTSGTVLASVDKSGGMVAGQVGDVATRLTVHGAVVVDGNIGARYQDVAEWVPVAEEMTAGTVVVVSGTTKNTVAASQHAYDTRVAGVVSAQPGVILGEESSTKAKIATTGRVKVRVDATKHPIALGDLLVTSDTAGAAMFSEPLDLGGVKIHRPGTLIGKALEPLASGQGEILVLLSMQ